jgi:hypothetical protein
MEHTLSCHEDINVLHENVNTRKRNRSLALAPSRLQFSASEHTLHRILVFLWFPETVENIYHFSNISSKRLPKQ